MEVSGDGSALEKKYRGCNIKEKFISISSSLPHESSCFTACWKVQVSVPKSEREASSTVGTYMTAVGQLLTL